jgi:hypothetical protein
MKRSSIIVALMSLAIAGCAKHRLTEDEFFYRNRDLESVYYTGTKEEAEAALRKQLILISEAEAAGLSAFEYDKIRFYTHVQLSRLANTLKKEEIARHEMSQAISYFPPSSTP